MDKIKHSKKLACNSASPNAELVTSGRLQFQVAVDIGMVSPTRLVYRRIQSSEFIYLTALFVLQELLNRKTCVCGTVPPVAPGSAAHHSVTGKGA